jgi:hypothetical protein
MGDSSIGSGGLEREAAGRRTSVEGMGMGGGETCMGGASMNLSIVNGVAKAMPPHVEAEFRRNGDELVEIWVNKGVSHHLARRCADDIIIMAQMAHWKVKRSKDEIGDNDDTSEMDASGFRRYRKTFRMLIDNAQEMPPE